MRNVTQSLVLRCALLVALPFGAASGLGCQADVPAPGTTTGSGGTGMTAGTGGNGAGGNAAAGTAGSGTGGAVVVDKSPCAGTSDKRLLPASQRILRLTLNETVNTIRYLIDNTEATALLTSGKVGQKGEDVIARDRLFPPLQQPTIIGSQYLQLNNISAHVGDYVLANYSKLTMALAGCADATDACATSYLSKLAARAYRRTLTTAEQTRFTALYNKLRNQTVNGYPIMATVQEATSYAVQALLSSPQLLWRWEIGNSAMASTSPPGVPLTDPELATHVSFFLTDQPPDDMLLSAANSGSLRTNLATHVTRLLATQQSKDWLRTIIETYYLINQLPNATIDTAVFPDYSDALNADALTESEKFLDNVLWNSNLTDLLLSKTAFVNQGLATTIYKIPVPAGATATNFVQTTLPSAERSGIMTNAGFLMSRSRADGVGLVIPRGRAVVSAVLCMPPNGPPDNIADAVKAAAANFDKQTAQEQVASRAAIPLCSSCHSQFDPYGLVLEYYDNLGRYVTTDRLGKPVDGHTKMPQALGGEPVTNALEVAQKFAASPVFTSCMATTVLQYAMVDYSAPVELSLPPDKPGCAAADVVQRYTSGGGKTFTDLVRAVAASPAFALRQVAAQ